ncbi:hypothetical protein K0M31_000474 [Melipona bicolor]|uniref:Uncharacterized protein n=1 Tax=Melipona bicolor TaxID=60889 RepID=A0AA40KX31_9HYME|nr:hypothetical protein K0M31_000474 [Melipona bicolor]
MESGAHQGNAAGIILKLSTFPMPRAGSSGTALGKGRASEKIAVSESREDALLKHSGRKTANSRAARLNREREQSGRERFESSAKILPRQTSTRKSFPTLASFLAEAGCCLDLIKMSVTLLVAGKNRASAFVALPPALSFRRFATDEMLPPTRELNNNYRVENRHSTIQIPRCRSVNDQAVPKFHGFRISEAARNSLGSGGKRGNIRNGKLCTSLCRAGAAHPSPTVYRQQEYPFQDI